jgi:uncharacterized protein YndB with AHSA1/START domain
MSWDFRPGGLERTSASLEGKQITWEALYRDIVEKERIVNTSVLHEGTMVATASLTTVEFLPEGDDTHLFLIKFGSYLDGREQPGESRVQLSGSTGSERRGPPGRCLNLASR